MDSGNFNPADVISCIV